MGEKAIYYKAYQEMSSGKQITVVRAGRGQGNFLSLG